METTRARLDACPLCDARLEPGGYRALVTYQRDNIVKCKTCDFAFSILIPSEKDYYDTYSNYNYVEEDRSETGIDAAGEQAVVNRLSAYRADGRVLDIAAGAGRLLKRFADAGFVAEGTEFSDEMRGYLERKGFKTYAGTLADGAPSGAYDIVVFTEVIEHINNPRPVLARIHDLLRPGGCVYITTPNFDSLERRLLKDRWGMICWPEHITYWTQRHLHRALTQAGFRKRTIRTRNISPYRVIQALKRGRFANLMGDVSAQSVSDAAQRSVAGNPVLGWAKTGLNGLLRAARLGSNMEAVYEKIPTTH